MKTEKNPISNRPMACIPAAISPGILPIPRGDPPKRGSKIEKRASEHLLRHANAVVLDNQPNPVAFRQQSDRNEFPIGSALLYFRLACTASAAFWISLRSATVGSLP